LSSASRSANGNQLTLARKRQAKQSWAFLAVSGILCPAWLWLLVFFGLANDDLIYHHRIDETGLTTTGLLD
jgi:hypothetical protein